MLGTIVDVTEVREPASARLRRCGGPRRSPRWPPSSPAPPASSSSPRSPCAARRCSAPSPARSPCSTPRRPLRLHLTSAAGGRRRAPGRRRRAARRRHRDRARRPAAHAARGPARPPGAARRPRRGGRPLPRDGRRHRLLGLGALAALPLRVEGRCWAASWSPGPPTTRSRRRRRGARGADRADRAWASRGCGPTPSATRPSPRWPRPTASCSCSPTPAGCCRGRWTSTRRSSSWPSCSCRRSADWCWMVVVDEQGRLHQAAPRRTGTPPGGTRWRAYVGGMLGLDDRGGRRAGWCCAPASRWWCRTWTGRTSSGRFPTRPRGRRWPGWTWARR